MTTIATYTGGIRLIFDGEEYTLCFHCGGRQQSDLTPDEIRQINIDISDHQVAELRRKLAEAEAKAEAEAGRYTEYK